MTQGRRSAHAPAVTSDDEARRAAILAYFDPATDAAAVHAHYHDDAVLEFPQSGERFEGIDNIRPWREQYPTPVAFTVRRIVGTGELWVVEVSASYDGGPPMLGVGVLEFDGVRVRRERIYVTEPWEPPTWRTPWRSAMPAEASR
jgi:hypothetical protein